MPPPLAANAKTRRQSVYKQATLTLSSILHISNVIPFVENSEKLGSKHCATFLKSLSEVSGQGTEHLYWPAGPCLH